MCLLGVWKKVSTEEYIKMVEQNKANMNQWQFEEARGLAEALDSELSAK